MSKRFFQVRISSPTNFRRVKRPKRPARGGYRSCCRLPLCQPIHWSRETPTGTSRIRHARRSTPWRPLGSSPGPQGYTYHYCLVIGDGGSRERGTGRVTTLFFVNQSTLSMKFSGRARDIDDTSKVNDRHSRRALLRGYRHPSPSTDLECCALCESAEPCCSCATAATFRQLRCAPSPARRCPVSLFAAVACRAFAPGHWGQ